MVQATKSYIRSMHKPPTASPLEGREEDEPLPSKQERNKLGVSRSVPTDLTVAHKLNHDNRRKCLIKTLAVFILSLEIIANYIGDNHHDTLQGSVLSQYDHPSLMRNLLQVFVLVAANNEVYAEATADSPAVDALEDDDEDDEELDASASNEYPDGENDNDESYEDADDDRQESRITEQWIKPTR